MKKISILLSILILVSCSSPKKQIELIQSQTDNAGILVVKFGDVEMIGSILLKYGLYRATIMEICNIYKQDECLELKNYFEPELYDNPTVGTSGQKKLSISPEYYVFIVPQGEYYVKSFRTSDMKHRATGDYIGNKPTLAKITIRKDKMIYIGDVERIFVKQKSRFSLSSGTFELCITNRFEDVKKYIELSMPFLNSNKLEYKPLELGTDAEMKCD